MTGADITAVIKKQPIGFACLAIALVCGGLIYWRSDKISEQKDLYDQKAKEDEHVLANVRNAAGLPQQAEAMQRAASQLEERLVAASRLATNLQFFYRLESETGVKLLDVRQGALPARAAGKGLYVGVPYTVSIQGNLKQVLDFIQHIESGPHLAKFSGVAMNKTDSTAGETMTVSMKLDLLGTP